MILLTKNKMKLKAEAAALVRKANQSWIMTIKSSKKEKENQKTAIQRVSRTHVESTTTLTNGKITLITSHQPKSRGRQKGKTSQQRKTYIQHRQSAKRQRRHPQFTSMTSQRSKQSRIVMLVWIITHQTKVLLSALIVPAKSNNQQVNGITIIEFQQKMEHVLQQQS